MTTLHEREEQLPLEHALNIVIGVCAGLHYAHEKVGFDGQPLDIVHRDVTPQNVIVTYDGGVKLLDFGIAKASNRFGETRFGTLKGKVPYMSPEQCRGEPLDRRSRHLLARHHALRADARAAALPRRRATSRC